MYQTECYCKPLLPDRYPLTEAPMRKLLQCACGRMTFFSLPCPNCGKVPDAFVFPEKSGPQDRMFRFRLFASVLGGGLLLTVSGYLLTSWVFGLLFFLLTLGATAITGLRLWLLDPGDRQYFWRLHGDVNLFARQTDLPVVDARSLEPLMDAWYLDMDRLERMGLRGDWNNALHGARWLSSVFRNPRLSRLMLQAHLQLHTEGRDCYDLDEICANLTEFDISPEYTVPFLNLVERVVREHGCQEEAQLKRLFAAMLRRHLERLATYRKIDNLMDAVGEELFRACGGPVTTQNGEKHGHIPMHAAQAFMDRLVPELSLRRREYVENGRWIAVFQALDKELDATYLDQASKEHAVRELELCFFHREEHLEPDNLLDAIRNGEEKDWDIRLLHPEQRHDFAAVLGRWETDEFERPYRQSGYYFLRELYADCDPQDGKT